MNKTAINYHKITNTEIKNKKVIKVHFQEQEKLASEQSAYIVLFKD